ncbi:unnamed protein product [Meloidogyne enterolobii]|uniref:Uncharacterized protein n=2 Tax=Meloidogyne enterolobii TaxID=390850 RepID=A0ACB0XNI2_MELEN|nr:unnamed protein product [Meloidogyne enterolobii]
MRLFEKNTFLTGFYATGPNASENGIYPNEGKLYNQEFVKFANGLLIEDTKLVGPWLLGADVFLRNQSKFQLSTLITGDEECAPSFSYLLSKYAGIHSNVVLNTNLKKHVGSSLTMYGVSTFDSFEFRHNLTLTGNDTNCLDKLEKGSEAKDCNDSCAKINFTNAYILNYGNNDKECAFKLSHINNCSCLEALNGSLKSSAKGENGSVEIKIVGNQLSHGNNNFTLLPKCAAKNIPRDEFKAVIGTDQPFVFKLSINNQNSTCLGTDPFNFRGSYKKLLTNSFMPEDLSDTKEYLHFEESNDNKEKNK